MVLHSNIGIQARNIQSLFSPVLTKLSTKKDMSVPTVHAQAVSASPLVTAVSAFPVNESYEIAETDFEIDSDFIEFIDMDMSTNQSAVAYTVPSADAYICDDFDDWLEEMEPTLAPTCTDAAAVPIASTIEHGYYCGHVNGPQMVKAEYYDCEVEEKIAKMKVLSLSDETTPEADNALFSDIIRDFASEAYTSWCIEEGGGLYYAESEVPEEEASIANCVSTVPSSGAFCMGSDPRLTEETHPIRSRSASDRKIDLVEQKRKHRTEAIQRWKQKRQDKLAENRLMDARQVATAKRERTNGKFAKRKINWVSITDASAAAL